MSDGASRGPLPWMYQGDGDDVPVCDVLSCEEIAQAWWDAEHRYNKWLKLTSGERRHHTRIVADLITRKVIIAGRRGDGSCR